MSGIVAELDADSEAATTFRHVYIQGWVHTALSDAELDTFHAEIFTLKKQPCEHPFRSRLRVQFRLKKKKKTAV